MIRWLRVVHSNLRMTYEAKCRHCGDLAYFLTEEEIFYRRQAGMRNPLPTISVIKHDCRKFVTGQLLHNGKKPRA